LAVLQLMICGYFLDKAKLKSELDFTTCSITMLSYKRLKLRHPA
jgi:hypothetical protein